MSHIYVSFSLIVSASTSDDTDQDSSAQMDVFLSQMNYLDDMVCSQQEVVAQLPTGHVGRGEF